MRAVSLTTSLILISLALAGCVGSEEEALDTGPEEVPDAQPASFSESTGGIDGFVVDGELLPVAGAQVAILDPEVMTTTDASGRFSFSELEPGNYDIFIQALGYEAVGQRVAVSAGDVTVVELTIEAIQVADPYHYTLRGDGLMGCGLSWRPAVVYSGVAVCGVLGIVGLDEGLDSFLLTYEITDETEGWQSLVVEAQWQNTQALGAGLSIPWEKNGCSNDNGATFADTDGSSPHYALVERSTIEGVMDDSCQSSRCDEDHCQLQSRVFSYPDTFGENSEADVGFTFQQKYSTFLTFFFHEEAPELFRAIEDA